MTLPNEIRDREYNKFEDTSSGPAVRTTLVAGDIEIGAVEIKDGATDRRAEVTANNQIKVFDNVLNSLVPAQYDYIELSYTGSDLTGVVFKTGGSGGTTVSTLTLAYSSGNLVSVTKS